MKLEFLALFLVVLGGCGGTPFQTLVDDSTLPDAGFPVPEVDATPTPLEVGADVRAGSDASGSVEASTDAGSETTLPEPPEAGNDVRDVQADAWPADVVVEPWCPESEFYPTYSVTCDTWGQAHGWTLQGCCLPDHTCGAASGSPRICRK